MVIPNTIEEDILQKDDVPSHRMLNNTLEIKYTGSNETVLVPINSLFSKYGDFIDKICMTYPLTDSEKAEYWYSPKKFSLDLYGTTAYWSMILYLNEAHSVMDFTPENITFMDPSLLNDLINEILIMESLL